MSHSEETNNSTYTCTAGLSENAVFIAALAAYDQWRAAEDKNSAELAPQRKTLDRWHEIKQSMDRFIETRGRRYSGCTFDNYVAKTSAQKKIVAAMKEYATNSKELIRAGKNVLLIGPKGTGKDHLLVALAKLCTMESGLVPHWQNGVELLDRFKQEAMSSNIHHWGCPLVGAEILYVSDPLPPTGSLSENEQKRLFRVVDGRYSNLKPTWMTLNVKDGDEAEIRMGAQTVDRLRHDALVLFCNWESYRELREAFS